MKQKSDIFEVLDFESNPYYRDSPENFLALVDLMRRNKTQYASMLGAKGSGYKCKARPYRPRKQPKYGYLREWIERLLPMLSNSAIRMSTKVKWILEGRTEFPKCAVCGEDDYYRTYNVSFGYDYPRTCCIKCQNNDPTRKCNLIESNRLKYGCDWPKQNAAVQGRDEQGLFEKYGVRNVFQLDDIKEKSKRTNELKHGDPNWRNHEQSSCTQRCFSGRKKRTVANKRRASNQRRFGVDFPSQSQAVKGRLFARYLERTGFDHPMHDPETRRKCSFRYTFDGESFDSSYELVVFLYVRDNVIPLKHLSDTSLPYDFDDKTHFYYPDFLDTETGRFIEIKGSHFFREDGTMFCPYRYPGWTDEQYGRRCRLEEAKRQCMLENGVLVIRTNSICMRVMLEYVNAKYPPRYVEGFRNSQTKNPEKIIL